MRLVQLADIELTARVLMACPAASRWALLARLWSEADIADRYRKRLGRQHPYFGAGCLMSAASRYAKAPRPDGCNPTFLECIGLIVEFLLELSVHQDA